LFWGYTQVADDAAQGTRLEIVSSVHGNHHAFSIGCAIKDGVTSTLAIKNKTKRLRNSHGVTGTNRGELAHAGIATSMGLIRMSSTGGISLWAIMLSR
jgi:hypothetical protein